MMGEGGVLGSKPYAGRGERAQSQRPTLFISMTVLISLAEWVWLLVSPHHACLPVPPSQPHLNFLLPSPLYVSPGSSYC